MEPEEFMQMGFLCYSLRAASYRGGSCQGTFTHMDLANAYAL